MAAERIDSHSRAAVLVLAVLIVVVAAGLEYLARRLAMQRGPDPVKIYASAGERIDAAAQRIARQVARDDVALAIAPREPLEVEDASDPAPMTDGRLVLTGISWTEQRPLAFINGRMVTNGATVGQHRVVSIEAEQVIVRGADDEERVLRIQR